MNATEFNNLDLKDKELHLLSDGKAGAINDPKNGLVLSYYALHSFTVGARFDVNTRKFTDIFALVTNEHFEGLANCPATSLLKNPFESSEDA